MRATFRIRLYARAESFKRSIAIRSILSEDSSIYSDDPFVTYVRWWVTDGEAEMLDANGDDISSLGEG